MSQPAAQTTRVPRWLIAVGSVAICLHLAALGINVLAAPSGPWVGAEGAPVGGRPPAFAQELNDLGGPTYLSLSRIDPNYQLAMYRFDSNRPGGQGVYVVAHVKDEKGELLKTVRLPDPGANPWVRHREEQLAERLAFDEAVQPLKGEVLAPVGQALTSVSYWDGTGRTFRLKTVSENDVPRTGPVFKPSKLSLLLAQSYARYLCRTYGGASAEIIRHSREVIPPGILFQGEPPPGAFDENVHNFGELPR